MERANKDIENMLATHEGHMSDNKSNNRSEDIRYVQFISNRWFHSRIQQSLHKVIFASEPRVSFTMSPLPSDVIKNADNEEDLLKVLM